MGSWRDIGGWVVGVWWQRWGKINLRVLQIICIFAKREIHKYIIYILMKQPVILAAAVILCLCSCGRKASVSTGWSDTIPVDIMVVGDVDATTERNYVGDISSEKEISLAFTLGGELQKVYVKNGQHVAKGQVLATIDSTTAASMHATAKATLRQAEDAYNRLKGVYTEGGVSEVRWMQMLTDLEKARQSETSARKHLEECTMRAPFSGTVSCGDIHEGQEMRPGEPVCSVLDMSRLRVSFSVPEQEIYRIEAGDKATATVPALGDRELGLRISDKSLEANPLGHTYRVRAAIISGEQDKLLPDMVAKVKVESGKRIAESGEKKVVVPTNCIHTMPDGQMVWVIEGGVACRRNVTVGDFVRSGVMVDQGLANGDTVVVGGHQKLYTGAKLKVASVK